MKKKTYTPKEGDIVREWLLIDAQDKTLGRLAVRIASFLMGKHKPGYAAHVLCGDYVVVINAKGIKVTGNKLADKIYDKYSGYPGGRKLKTLGELMTINPSLVIEKAVKGMLPKNRLASRMITSLKVYDGSEHLHTAQKLRKVEL